MYIQLQCKILISLCVYVVLSLSKTQQSTFEIQVYGNMVTVDLVYMLLFLQIVESHRHKYFITICLRANAKEDKYNKTFSHGKNLLVSHQRQIWKKGKKVVKEKYPGGKLPR